MKKRKCEKEVRKMLELNRTIMNIKEKQNLGENREETFLEKNARESNEIATSNFQAAIREAERDSELKEMSIQLKKVLKNLEQHEKRLEKIERKLLSFQDNMLMQKEWSYEVDRNIKTLNKETKKQGKDIFRVKNIFESAWCARGAQQNGQFKHVAKQIVKFYNKKAKQGHGKNISSCKDILQIQENDDESVK